MAVAAAGFAMIGLDAVAHHGQTNSGTQPYVRHDPDHHQHHHDVESDG